jgi:nucleotide-binding universal stress UspA family protein
MKKRSIRNILVPIDFSKMSINAIETAKRLGQRFTATIHLAHVHHWQYPADFVGPVISSGFLPESFEEDRNKQLAEELKTIASKSGLSPRYQTHLRTGAAPFHEICRLAQEIPADLIVMPTHGHTGLAHVLLGSTAERVVQHSPCPVFVVRAKKRKQQAGRVFTADTILVPIDFSPCSLEGLNYAISFANKIAAKVILFHAVHLAAYIGGGYAYDLSSLEGTVQKQAQRQMQGFVRLAKFGGVKFETVITIGAPIWKICEFAGSRHVDLIITATHGWTGFKHLLIGSTAEHVVRHASCSVLVVPSHPTVRVANLTPQTPRGRRTRRPIARKKTLSGILAERKNLTRKRRRLAAHPFPERRKTNKFRETHTRR